MAKKKSRKSRTSKGIHGTTRAGSTSTGLERLINQYNAFLKGKNVRVTVETTDPRFRFRKVDAKTIWANTPKVKKENK